MKSERRHQLQENSLAHALAAAPFWFRKYGTQILLALLIVILAIVLIRNRAANARQAREQMSQFLASARNDIGQIARDQSALAGPKPEDALTSVKMRLDRAEKLLSAVLETADDPKLLAEARLAQGDLSWQLASIPALPAATTRPSLKLDKGSDQYLDQAADAYKQVSNDAQAASLTRLTARLSLAAIAENRKQWDEARTQYQSVIDDGSAAEPFKLQARNRLAALDLIKVETFVNKPAAAGPVEGPNLFPTIQQLATQPLTAPATTAPAATAPATKPAAATPGAGPEAPAPAGEKK